VKFQTVNFNVPSTSFVQHTFGIFVRSATSDLEWSKVAWPIDFSWLQSSHGTERTPIAYVFGNHQKYELMTKLFLCYQAVTALMKRFCQIAFAVLRRDGRAARVNCGLSADLIGRRLLGLGEV
jgi:hypothetical protein